ncbi:hypothetical protein Bca52824_064166 [Brassica carinata]|uniref:Uncharacterized protein n=1 Tax=Brassica carinata TaxID=52824 RepID=A0A8X7U9W2_BRACI|nr:hypothetical protein Bca52824_064166 [Brassica carinata]
MMILRVFWFLMSMRNLMASITEKEPYESEEGVREAHLLARTHELDVAAREFTDKKGKGPRVEEASSVIMVWKAFRKGLKRLMGSLSEVCVTVNKMDTRLGVIEKSHKILKRRFKKMKVEKRLTSLEEYQRRLIRGAKKQKAIEERLDGIEKDMKRKENENENNEGEEEKAEEEVEAELQVETEEVEAYKEPEVEEEGGVEVETEPRVDAEQDKEKQKGEETMNEGNEMGTETRVGEEVEAYKEPEVEEEGGVEMETEPPRGRTKAAAAYMGRGSRTVSLKWDDEVSAVDETALSGKDKQGWILTVFKSKDGASL